MTIADQYKEAKFYFDVSDLGAVFLKNSLVKTNSAEYRVSILKNRIEFVTSFRFACFRFLMGKKNCLM